MSFLTDLFEGNFGNLGTDLSHAPSSFVTDIGSEAPYLIGAGALAAAPFVLPEIGAAIGGLGAADAAAAPAVAAAGAGDLVDVGGIGATAAGDTLALDPAVASVGGIGATAAGDTLALDPAVALGTDPAAVGADAFAGLDLTGGTSPLAATDFAPLGGDVSAYTYTDESIAPFIQPDTSAGYSTLPDYLNDPSVQAYTDPNFNPGAAAAAPTAGTGAGATPAGYSDATAAMKAFPPGSSTAAAVAPEDAGLFGHGGFLGTSLTGKEAALFGLAGAPLALALLRGQQSLPPQAQQSQQNAAALSAFGQQQLAQGQAGQLNAGQMAYLQNMQNGLQNQALQTMYNMGVKDPTHDSRWPQMQAQVALQVSAQTQQFIQQEIQNGLSALGASSTTLNQVAQMQIQQDQAFTNTLSNATQAAARVLAGNVGSQTITLKAA